MSESARATFPRPADPVPYLFDTDAISEVLRPKPAVEFVAWLATIPRALTVLSYERSAARVFGRIRADLEQRGAVLPDADLRIAAIALYYGLELVTGNLRHFERIPGLRVNRALADARQGKAKAGRKHSAAIIRAWSVS